MRSIVDLLRWKQREWRLRGDWWRCARIEGGKLVALRIILQKLLRAVPVEVVGVELCVTEMRVHRLEVILLLDVIDAENPRLKHRRGDDRVGRFLLLEV